MAKEISVPAIELKQGNETFYLFKIDAKELVSIVDVNRRDPDKGKGYQRYFTSSRIKAIAKYYDAGNAIPTSILVSFDKAKYDNGKLIITNKKSNGWVIDGQHRLLGANQSSSDVEVPVIGFVSLSEEKQVQHFVVINKEARGVPSSLYIDLLRSLPASKKPGEIAKERVANIFTELNKDEESPFYGRIVIVTSPKKGELSLTNIARKIESLVYPGKGLLAGYPLSDQVKIFSNYFGALKHVYVEEFERDIPIIYQTVGFGAFANVFQHVFTYSLNKNKGSFTKDDVISIFKKMDHISFDSWRQGTGSQAEASAAKDLMVELTSIVKDEGDEGSIKL